MPTWGEILHELNTTGAELKARPLVEALETILKDDYISVAVAHTCRAALKAWKGE